MREIEFRLWDKQTNKMYYQRDEWFFDNEYDAVHFSLNINGFLAYKTSKDAILLQYTGMNDSKGNNIYEGDIVKYRQRNLDQAFGIEDGPAYIERIIEIKYRGQSFNVPAGFIKDLEVIGNIYENSNLLEETK